MGCLTREHDTLSMIHAREQSVEHVQIGCRKSRVVFLRLIDQIKVQYHLTKGGAIVSDTSLAWGFVNQ